MEIDNIPTLDMFNPPKVGIITAYTGNIGSILQATALFAILSKKGYDCSIIKYTKEAKVPDEPRLLRLIKKIKHFSFFSKKRNFFLAIYGILKRKKIFRKISNIEHYYKLTDSIDSIEKLHHLNQEFDIFICGSDQIWAPSIFDPNYMLSFVDDNHIKFSYAASIGLNTIPSNLKKEYKKYLSRLDYISVRENQAKQLLKEACNLDAITVLDPTLLHTSAFWDNYIVRNFNNEQFIFCYFLAYNPEQVKIVEDYAESQKLKVIIHAPIEGFKVGNFDYLQSITSEDFLYFIKYAQCIFTDSFHGTLFSINYGKIFWTFKRFADNDPNCQNSRILNILKILNLEQRLLEKKEQLNYDDIIDYSIINKKISSLREQSLAFLGKALGEKGQSY